MSIIAICLIGIFYYGVIYKKSVTKTDNVAKNKIKDGIVYAQYKNNQVPSDRIKTFKRADNILSSNSDKMVFSLGKMIKTLDRKTDKRELVKYIGDNDELMGVCSDGKIIAWIEDQRLENFEEDGRCLYYKIIGSPDDKLVYKSLRRERGTKGSDYIGAKDYMFNRVQIQDNKIIYVVFDISESSIIYKEYDILDGKEKILFTDKYKDDNKILYDLNGFDIDLSNGYIVADIADKTEQYKSYLTLYDLNKKTKCVLAKKSLESSFSTSINYPNIAFEMDKYIHVYNIKKNKDDFTIICNGRVRNVDIRDGYISWNENRIYVYSMKDNKSYMIDNGWKQQMGSATIPKGICGDILYWMDDKNNVRYIKLGDIK